MRVQVLVMCAAMVAVAGCTGETTDDSATLCETIPTEMLERLSGDYTSHEGLLLGREQFIGCDTDGLSSFEFGVQVIDLDLPLEGHLVGEAEAFDDLGDEAYRSPTIFDGELVGETLVAARATGSCSFAMSCSSTGRTGPLRTTPRSSSASTIR